tara:strand:+ start:1121 stop:1525 length:405 start_codon:yes stop_codon:yes gene_type:complete
MKMLDQYIKLTNKKPDSKKYAKLYIPKPTLLDYKKGYIIRYFAKQVNDQNAPIIEINKSQYKSWTDNDSGLDNGFYKVTSIKWKISGPDKNIIKNGFLYEKSIFNANKDMVMLKSNSFPGLSDKLVNYLQFAKK